MTITFVFNGLTVDDQTQAYVEKKIAAAAKLCADVERATVDIAQDKRGQYRVEVMLSTPRNTFRAEEIAETIAAAVDIVEEELKRQARQDHEKRIDLARRGGRSLKKKTVVDDAARF